MPLQGLNKDVGGRTQGVALGYELTPLRGFSRNNPAADVARVRSQCPWYRHKFEPSFADMLASARRELWTSAMIDATHRQGTSIQYSSDTLEWLLAAA